jgi:hypothetical protein
MRTAATSTCSGCFLSQASTPTRFADTAHYEDVGAICATSDRHSSEIDNDHLNPVWPIIHSTKKKPATATKGQ